MPFYAIVCRDKPGALETRLATRPVHLDYLKEAGNLKLAGPLLDDDGNPNGSLLVVEAADQATVQAWVDNDPYALAGVFERVEIRPWRVVIGAL